MSEIGGDLGHLRVLLNRRILRTKGWGPLQRIVPLYAPTDAAWPPWPHDRRGEWSWRRRVLEYRVGETRQRRRGDL